MLLIPKLSGEMWQLPHGKLLTLMAGGGGACLGANYVTSGQRVGLKCISIRERSKTNRVEHLRNTLKDRTKTQKGLDSDASAQVMVDAIKLNYNFARPHMALGGLTPAEAAGLDLQLKGNRWRELIRQATVDAP